MVKTHKHATILQILLLITLLITTQTYAVLTDAALYFSFDPNEVSANHVHDASGNGTTYRIMNGTNVTGGVIGSYMNLSDQNEYLMNESVTDIYGKEVTLCSWVQTTNTGTRPLAGSSRPVPGGYYGFHVTFATTDPLAGIGGSHYQKWAANATIVDGNWHHYCYYLNSTADGTLYTYLYMDGSPLPKGTKQELTRNNPWTMDYIGYDSQTYSLMGNIDELGLWYRQLSAAEILTLYNGGSGYNPFTASDPTTISVQAWSDGKQIDIFDANISYRNGNDVVTTQYSTSIGQINTSIIPGIKSLNNITVMAPGFSSHTMIGTNSTAIISNHTQLPLTGSTSLSYTALKTGNIITTTCTYTNEGNLAIPNITYTYNNTNDTTITTHLNAVNYTINRTDFLDQLAITCTPCTIYNCTRSSNTTIAANQIDSNLVISIQSFVGGLVSNSEITDGVTGGTYYSNPLTYNLSQFLNQSSHTRYVNINITDLDDTTTKVQHVMYLNETNLNFTLLLNYTQLLITFMDFNYNGASSYWLLSDNQRNLTRSTTNATYIIYIQQNLSQGPVYVKFGNYEPDYNETFTQYYEYINNNSQIDINISLLENQNNQCYFYLRIIDPGSRPIENTIIKAYSGNASGEMKFIGQRLTPNTGITYFYGDPSHEILLTILANGYEASLARIYACQQSYYTPDNPLPISLTKSSNVFNFVYFTIPYTTFNESIMHINGTVMDSSADEINITTSYRISQGYPHRTISTTKNFLGYYTFTLHNDSDTYLGDGDFDNSLGDNVTVTLYLDGTLHEKTILLEYDSYDFYLNTGDITENLKAPLAFILLLLIVITIQFLTTSPTMGITVYMIGTILLSTIAITFIWSSVIILIYYVFLTLRKIFLEE